MARRGMRVRREPQRRCIACRTARGKRDLIRVARTADGRLAVDETGKGPGRGAYLCRRRACWRNSALVGRLGQALSVRVTSEDAHWMADYAERLPDGDEPTIDGDDHEQSLGRATNG